MAVCSGNVAQRQQQQQRAPTADTYLTARANTDDEDPCCIRVERAAVTHLNATFLPRDVAVVPLKYALDAVRNISTRPAARLVHRHDAVSEGALRQLEVAPPEILAIERDGVLLLPIVRGAACVLSAQVVGL